jgi:hypothetical protein
MTTRKAATLRSVAVPVEHGGWSLTLEPALLGLLVAPSWSGLLLAAAALLGFVARTPLRVALVDRYRNRSLERTRLATSIVAAEAALAAVLLVAAFSIADHAFWVPLVLAAPLIAVEVWYDARSRGRRLVPELAGTIGVASTAAAISLAGGADGPLAAGLWAIAAARAVAAVGFVRVQLRRAKDQPHRVLHSDVAQVVALGMVAAAFAVDAAPLAGVLAVGGIAAAHLWLARRPPPAAPVLGAQQVVLGLTLVLVAGLGAAAP